MNNHDPKVGISLGGGATLGMAHIGVLRLLEEQKVPINYITGTSAGAIIGSLYAFGVPIDEIEKEAKRLSWNTISDVTLSKLGLISNDSLRKLMIRLVGEKQIEEANIPLSIVTTDLHTGEQVIFREGPLAEVVQASAAIPGIFNPVIIDGKMLVDGGLSNNLPHQILLDMGAEVTVGVNVLASKMRYDYPKKYSEVIANSFMILMAHARNRTREKFDVLIEPDLSKFTSSDFSKILEIIESGSVATAPAVSDIKKLISRKESWWKKASNLLNF